MKNQNISLNEVKNSAFLANASYGTERLRYFI